MTARRHPEMGGIDRAEYLRKSGGAGPQACAGRPRPELSLDSIDCHREADQGVGRGRGRPLHHLRRCPGIGKLCGITYGDGLRLRFRDDGRGIPPDILEAGRAGHYGLNGMRERARQIGASLDIWSGIGTGTEVDLSVPGSIVYRKSPGRSRLQLFRKKVG
jgi:hypothetical protein